MAPSPNRVAQAILGHYASKQKIRILKFSAIVLVLDFVSKLIALATLHEDSRTTLFGGNLWFQLQFNATALGVRSQEHADSKGLPWMLGMQVCLAGLGALSLPFASAEQRMWRKILLVSTIFIATILLAGPVGNVIYPFLGPGVIPAVKILSAIMMTLAFLRLARSRTLFALLAILASANLANIINILVFPRGVIDFSYIPSLARFFGVANLADYVLGTTVALLFVFIPLRILVAGVRHLAKNRKLGILDWVDKSLGNT